METLQLLQPNAEQTQALLERCSNIKELKQIHGQLLKKGTIKHQITVSRLLASCASIEFGNLAYARMIFDRISSPNTVMWNTMIKAYSSSNDPEAALLLYQQMLYHSVPHNGYTFPFLLKACSALSAFEETQQIHAHIIKKVLVQRFMPQTPSFVFMQFQAASNQHRSYSMGFPREILFLGIQ
ncbi:Tetratricopeptide-like helical domain superfamily [Sesbania bispinosa]|nr:Tetratricopeptide-like helical domain superfamily [Sesbania bispinosa]